MKIKTLLALLIITVSTAFAQSIQIASKFDRGIIKGSIIDAEDGSPLPSANITLYNQKDSSFSGGISSGIDGEFIIKNVSEGKYYLKISFVGYTNKYVSNISMSMHTGEFNAGTVKLEKNTLQLNETQIIGERTSEELHLDKKVINVDQNINAKGGTALDVLQDQSSVRIDPDGTVYLRGSSNFKVLINGKPSVLQGADALRQMSANMIDNIEIITNPSAKYDAEGSAGIINIILKKQKDYTFSGIANITSGTRDKYNGDFSFNYNVNGINLNGGLDYRNNTNYNDQGVDRISSSPESFDNNTTRLSIKDRRKQYSARAGLDVSLSERSSASISLSAGEMDIFTSINSRVNNENPNGIIYMMNESLNSVPVNYFNSTLNFDQKFEPEINNLSFEVSYSHVLLPNDKNSYEYSTDPFFSLKSGNPSWTVFGNDANRDDGRIKLTYSHKLDPRSTLEIGTQSNLSYRKFNIENKIFDWNNSVFSIDNNLTNNFIFRNNVYAAFATYTNSFYEFDFMLGLRGEYTDRLLEQKTTNGNYKFLKMDYFPSLNISRKIGDHQIQFSYSRRINRPNENLLNPFPFYTDSYLTSAGNPNLLPEYINSYELNYQKMFGGIFFSVQTYYRNSDNSIMQTFRVDQGGKMLTTFGNFATTNTYGSEISSGFSIGQMLKLDPGFNLYGSDFNGDIVGMNINKSVFNWTARLNTTFIFSEDTRLQVSGNYFGKINEPQLDIKPFFILSASLKRDFFDKKLSVTLQARNLLKTSNLDIISNGTNFNSTIFVHQEVPVINLMLSYNFNNFKRANRSNDNIEIKSGL